MIPMIRQAVKRPKSGGIFPADIQGNVLSGYNHPVGAALFVRFGWHFAFSRLDPD